MKHSTTDEFLTVTSNTSALQKFFFCVIVSNVNPFKKEVK